MSEEMKALVVIPALNEEATVGSIVAAVRREGHEVLVVNDGSSDQTALVAEKEGALVLNLALNLGVGGALRAGFRFAVEHGFQSVVQVDADGQHPVTQIRNLEQAAHDCDAHLVIGSRYLSTNSTLIPSMPRRLSMFMLAWLGSRLTGTTLTDTTSGFRIIREPLLSAFADSFPDYYLGDTFEATISAARAGYKVQEIPAALAPRSHGESSVGVAKSIRLITKVLTIAVFRLHPSVKPFR